MRFTIWCKGERCGQFFDLHRALKDAVVRAFESHAEVRVNDRKEKCDYAVNVELADPSRDE